MSAEVLVFDILAVIAVVSAIGVILAKNPVHSAVALVVTFVNLAGIFVMLRAEFLAAVQIIVYTGAILVLVLFVIMLVQQDDLPEFHGGRPLQRFLAVIIGLMLLGEVAAAVLTRTAVSGEDGQFTEAFVERAGGNVQVLGQFLYSGYVLPVQAIAVVLLVGTIGALVMARPDEPVRRRERATATISLGHPRGADAEFDEILGLPSGAASPEVARVGTAEWRGGIIMVKDNESYTHLPAWELEEQLTRANGGRAVHTVADTLATDPGPYPPSAPAAVQSNSRVTGRTFTGHCVKCRQTREISDADFVEADNGRFGVEGPCAACGTNIFRFIKNTDADQLRAQGFTPREADDDNV